MQAFIPNRKTRADSTLDNLTEEQKSRLGRWLLDENRGYRDVCGLLAREFGVATSRSALSRYFQRRLAAVTSDQ